MRLFFTSLFVACIFITGTRAQATNADSTARKTRPPVKKFYIGGGIDGAIFSTATIKYAPPFAPGIGVATTTNSMGTLRFSYILNTGITFNFNPGRHIGIYTGVDVKNIGFIENPNGTKIKRRTYNIGVPLGIRIGNMAKKGAYIFLGGGADMPFNYREKAFVLRDQKTKFNEWFSERTPQIMPYVFAGLAIRKGVSFKVQYYPNNFLNPDFTQNLIKPYAGYDVHLILFSIGIVTHYGKKHDIVKKHVAELKTM